MANYIKTLQDDNASLQARIDEAGEALQEFRALLLSPKHQGLQADGSRNDWISTADALRYLENIVGKLSN